MTRWILNQVIGSLGWGHVALFVAIVLFIIAAVIYTRKLMKQAMPFILIGGIAFFALGGLSLIAFPWPIWPKLPELPSVTFPQITIPTVTMPELPKIDWEALKEKGLAAIDRAKGLLASLAEEVQPWIDYVAKQFEREPEPVEEVVVEEPKPKVDYSDIIAKRRARAERIARANAQLRANEAAVAGWIDRAAEQERLRVERAWREHQWKANQMRPR